MMNRVCPTFPFRRHCAPALAMVLLAACSTADLRDDAFSGEYEIWAMDQGTHIIHIFDSALNETARIDLGAQGARVPHLLAFTSDFRYAFVAASATGNVAVIRADDRQVVALVPTGPRTHHAAVAPDDRTVLVSVIGDANAPWDGKLVEIVIDRENEQFTVARELVLAEDPKFEEKRGRMRETGGAVYLDFTADGRHGYVTLGPYLEEGGAAVVDLGAMRLVEVFAPGEVQANSGSIRARDGRHMYLVGGDDGIGVWYAMDTRTHRVAHRAESGGHDAHGSAVSPDGREYWLVNRQTSNAVVIDTRTHEVLAEIPFTGKTPDVVAFSPDGRYVFITLRGPNPVTMPHLAVGETPGLAVFDARTRELVRVVEPAKGNARSDFHGIAVRPR